MALTFTVDGVNVSGLVDVSTLLITQVLTRRGDTAHFDVLAAPGAVTFIPFLPVQITDEQGNSKFGGIITRVRQMVEEGPVMIRWRLYCQDYSYYLQHRLANKKYQNMTVDAIVKDLLASFPPGVTITTNHVQANLPVITFFNVHYVSLADAFDRLVRMSLASAYLMWDVDAQGDLHFFDQNHVPAADVVLVDWPPGAGEANILRNSTFYYETDASQLANSVTFRGGTYLSAPFTDTWVGNGQQLTFPLSYAPDTDPSAGGYVPTVTVGGVAQTVALDTNSGFGSNECLVSIDQTTRTAVLRFATAPGSGVVIEAAYVFDMPVLVRRQNRASIQQYGTWEQYVVDSSVKTQAAAGTRAGSLLSQFAVPLEKALFDVDMTYIGSLGAGKLVTVSLLALGVTKQMVVTDCRITGRPGGRYQHQVELAAFS